MRDGRAQAANENCTGAPNAPSSLYPGRSSCRVGNPPWSRGAESLIRSRKAQGGRHVGYLATARLGRGGGRRRPGFDQHRWRRTGAAVIRTGAASSWPAASCRRSASRSVRGHARTMTAAGRKRRPPPSSRYRTSIAGVLMQLGAGRFARAALARQRGRMGLCDQGPLPRHHHRSAGPFAERSTSAPGDVWYFPRGFGHSIQGIGREDCLFVLVFDNGYFSEFAPSASPIGWRTRRPRCWQKNLRRAGATFANFPKKEVYIVQGAGAAAAAGRPRARHAQHRAADAPLPAAGAEARRSIPAARSAWCRSANSRSRRP